MPNEQGESQRWTERRFENEPADEMTAAYARGGPVRSDEPERDYFFERNAAPPQSAAPNDRRQLRRMSWRAAGVQDYPGGALQQLIEASHRREIEASHRGKGPRSYRPTDERLRENVCERLTDDPFIDATDIDVSVADGEITVSGTVDTRQTKFSVEEVVWRMPGVAGVCNALKVRRA
jgi:hypothetical protein